MSAFPPKYTYRGYLIFPAYTVFENWTFQHKDYSYGNDNRTGGGETIAECKEKIDRLIDEN